MSLGRGRSLLISCLMLVGLLVRTRIRSPKYTASSILWVMKITVVLVAAATGAAVHPPFKSQGQCLIDHMVRPSEVLLVRWLKALAITSRCSMLADNWSG